MDLPQSAALENGWDEETSILFAQLNLEDIYNIQVVSTRKGKGWMGAPISDEELALKVEEENLHTLLGFFSDRRFAQSLDNALRSDRDTLNAYSTVERAARDDHQAALAYSRGEDLPRPSAYQQSLERLANTNGDSRHNTILDEMTAAHPGASTLKSLRRRSTTWAECTICTENFVALTMYQSPCGHSYCTTCLVDLVETSTRDESLHPLRCCKRHFSVEEVASHLTLDLRSRFYAKCIEFGTPSGCRIYCPKQTCSAFLGSSDNLSSSIVCHACTAKVCSSCKNVAHPGGPCAQDDAILEVKALAQEKLWQTCPNCQAIIELSQGCYHMTCTCGTEFCYLCAQYWKHCNCPFWDESRLMDTAQHRVVNQFGPTVDQPGLHAERVQQMVANLRLDHECAEHRWRFRHGGGMCEECNYSLRTYLMRCTNCQALACRRCTRNRL